MFSYVGELYSKLSPITKMLHYFVPVVMGRDVYPFHTAGAQLLNDKFKQRALPYGQHRFGHMLGQRMEPPASPPSHDYSFNRQVSIGQKILESDKSDDPPLVIQHGKMQDIMFP